jgi:hypothetical protein
MKIKINEEWAIEADGGVSWNLVYQSAEISKETGKRVSTVETSYHGSLEQACLAYIEGRTSKAAKAKHGPNEKHLHELIAVTRDAGQEIRQTLEGFFGRMGREQLETVPRTISRGDGEGGEAHGPDGDGHPKRVRKAGAVRSARGIPAVDDQAGTIQARL